MEWLREFADRCAELFDYVHGDSYRALGRDNEALIRHAGDLSNELRLCSSRLAEAHAFIDAEFSRLDTAMRNVGSRLVVAEIGGFDMKYVSNETTIDDMPPPKQQADWRYLHVRVSVPPTVELASKENKVKYAQLFGRRVVDAVDRAFYGEPD